MIAIQPTFFRPSSEYNEAVEYLFTRIKQALPADGTAGALIPGEPEQERKALREKEGIPIDGQTWEELLEIANELDISIEASSDGGCGKRAGPQVATATFGGPGFGFDGQSCWLDARSFGRIRTARCARPGTDRDEKSGLRRVL